MMALFIPEHKAVFIRVPKTGSTAVLTRFCEGQGGHVPAARLRDRIGRDRWPDWFSFAFVRNPWDRVVSAWYYLRFSLPVVPEQMSFTDFVATRTFLQAWTGSHFHQLPYLVDGAGAIIVSFIGRYEHLQRDVDRISARLDLPCSTLRRSGSARPPGDTYRHHYTDETRRVVAGECRADIEAFGYTF